MSTASRVGRTESCRAMTWVNASHFLRHAALEKASQGWKNNWASLIAALRILNSLMGLLLGPSAVTPYMGRAHGHSTGG